MERERRAVAPPSCRGRCEDQWTWRILLLVVMMSINASLLLKRRSSRFQRLTKCPLASCCNAVWTSTPSRFLWTISNPSSRVR